MDQSVIAFVANRRWPFAVMIAICALWLLAAVVGTSSAGPALPTGALSAAAAPLLVLLLLLALLPPARRRQDVAALADRVEVATAAAGALEEQLGRIYSTLADCAERVEQLQQGASADGNGLAASAQALDASAARLTGTAAEVRTAADRLQAALPDLVAQADGISQTIANSGADTAAMLQSVQRALGEIAQALAGTGAQSEGLVDRMQGLLRDIGETSAEMTKTLAGRAYTLDAAVTGVLDRASTAFAGIGQNLAARASEVQAMLATAQTQLDSYGSDGARAIGQRLDILLAAAAQLKQHLTEHQSLSEGLQLRSLADLRAVEEQLAVIHSRKLASADALASAVQAQMDMLEARSSAAIQRLRQAECEQAEELAQTLASADERSATLHARQQASLDRLATQLTDMFQRLDSDLQALTARQQQLGAELAHTASSGSDAITATLAAASEQQAQTHAAMDAAAESAAAAIRGRFAALAQDSTQTLAHSHDHVAQVSAEVERLAAAITAQHGAMAQIAAQVARLMPEFEAFGSHVEARLPMLGNSFELLGNRSDAVASKLDELARQVGSQIELLHDSAAAFERDHGAVAGLAGDLATEFDAARQAIAEIDAHTERTALASATRMVENIVQVRQAVTGAAEEIHRLLGQVVAEAEDRLDGLAHSRAEAAFGAPIRLQITALEDASTRAAAAASTAAERLSSQLVELMRTIAQTEARIDEVDTRMDLRARDTLAGRAHHLIDSLQTASVDMTRLLSVDIGDEAWARYLNGDRSLFTRKIVRLGDRDMRRRVQRHYAHDSEFQREASLYLEEFEELIRRVLKDPDGEAFALVLLSSDIGKLYVLISQAIGRSLAHHAA